MISERTQKLFNESAKLLLQLDKDEEFRKKYVADHAGVAQEIFPQLRKTPKEKIQQAIDQYKQEMIRLYERDFGAGPSSVAGAMTHTEAGPSSVAGAMTHVEAQVMNQPEPE